MNWRDIERRIRELEAEAAWGVIPVPDWAAQQTEIDAIDAEMAVDAAAGHPWPEHRPGEDPIWDYLNGYGTLPGALPPTSSRSQADRHRGKKPFNQKGGGK